MIGLLGQGQQELLPPAWWSKQKEPGLAELVGLQKSSMDQVRGSSRWMAAVAIVVVMDLLDVFEIEEKLAECLLGETVVEVARAISLRLELDS